MIDVGRNLIERLLDECPDLLCDATIGWSSSRTRITNSAGIDAEYGRTNYYCYLGAQLIRGTDMLNIWTGHNSSKLFLESELDWILESMCRSLSWSTETASPTPSSGDLPVVFTPRGVAATLLRPLIAGFNGKNLALSLIHI